MKKWSYAAAMLLIASSGCVFTGCIDNDEPYGITQIRLATAELLKAKKDAVAAQAAAANAAVEIAKIEAEVKKAELEIQKITAQAEADAKIKQAEAEAAKTQAEANRLQAEADAIIELAKSKAAILMAKANEQIAKTEALSAKAAQELAEAKYAFEQSQLRDAAWTNDVLYGYVKEAFRVYLEKLTAYNEANEELLYTQKQYALSIVDLEYKDGKWVSAKYEDEVGLKKAVATAQKKVDVMTENIATYKEVLTEVEGCQPSDLIALQKKYEAERLTNIEALADIKVKLAQLQVDNKPLYDKQNSLVAQVEEAKAKEVEFEGYTFESNGELGLPNDIDQVVVEPGSFSYDGIAEDPEDNTYANAIEAYDNFMAGMQKYILDDNDVLWTNAVIAELTNSLKIQNEKFNNGTKLDWEKAKTLYNNGGKPDTQDLPGQKEIEDAVAAYNAEGAKLESLREAVETAKADLEAKTAIYDAELKKYQEETGISVALAEAAAKYAPGDWQYVWDEETQSWNYVWVEGSERTKASEAYRETLTSYNSKMAALVKEQDLIISQKNKDLADAEAELVKAKALANQKPNDAALAQKATEAETKRDTAIAAVTAAETTKTNKVNALQAEMVTAQINAREVYDKAIAVCDAEWRKANIEYNELNGNDPAYEPVKKAFSDYQDAQTALTEAETTLSDEGQKLHDACQELWDAYGAQSFLPYSATSLVDYVKRGYVTNVVIPTWENVQNYLDGIADFVAAENSPIEAVATETRYFGWTPGSYVNAKQYLIQKSQEAYGILGVNYDTQDNDWDFDQDYAFLLSDVTKDVVDGYIKKIVGPDAPVYSYSAYYPLFNAYGNILLVQSEIDRGTAFLNNNDLVATITADAHAAKDALVTLKEDNDKAIETLESDLEDVIKEIGDLEQPLLDEQENLNALQEKITDLLDAITTGITSIEGAKLQGLESLDNIDAIDTDKTSVKTTIAALEALIEKSEKQLANRQAALELAQYQLDQYENGYKDAEYNPWQVQVVIKQNAVDEAKEALDIAKAHLDEVQAKYEAATANN